MPQDFPGSQYQSGYVPSGCLLAKLSYSNELMAEVNQAVPTPPIHLHSFLFFFSSHRHTARATERAHVKYSWSVTICHTIKQITALPFSHSSGAKHRYTGAINLFCRQQGFHSILMQNLFSFSFDLTPRCLGPDQYKEEGGMSSAEITTTTNQMYMHKGTGLNLHQA